MRNKITAVVFGKPQLVGNQTITSWLNEVADDRWKDLDFIENGYNIIYFEDDKDIVTKLYSARGFDVIACIVDEDKTFEEQYKNLLSLNNNSIEKVIILCKPTITPVELGRSILNLFYLSMDNYQDAKESFTIFTPCYNTPRSDFMRLYKSLCNQTYGSWEWFILDDSDNGIGVEKYIKELCDFRIRCIKNITNHGSIGYNKRLLAMGALNEYLLEVDHDDELLPNCLAKLHEAFVKYPECGFCYSNCVEVCEHGPNSYGESWGWGQGRVTKAIVNGEEFEISWTPDINEASIRHIVGVPNHARCWRSDVYREIYGHNPNYSIADDYDLIVRTFLKTKFCFVNDFLYIQHEEKPTSQIHRSREIQRCVECIQQINNKRIHDRVVELSGEDKLWDYEKNTIIENASNVEFLNKRLNEVLEIEDREIRINF